MAALLVLVLSSATPITTEGVREASRSVLADPDLQRELPSADGHGTAGPGDRPGGLRPLRDQEATPMPTGSPIGSTLLWVIIAVTVVLAGAWFVRELRNYREDAVVAPPSAPADAHAAIVQKPLGDAEVLARCGRYGEAIHVLLLTTLAELTKHMALPPSLTSREILARAPIGLDAREALSGLVASVEVSHFGDVVPGEADYRVSVESFRRFATAYTRGAAR